MHKVIKTQTVSVSVNQIWDFFSTTDNLAKITPEHLNFSILSRPDVEDMYPGMIITYKISPALNISVKWATEISQVKELKYFIDNQIKGPFKIWHHEHHFKKVENGTEIKDVLYYDIPYGFIGRILHKLFIRKRVDEIFKFREKKIKELFGSA